MVTFTNQQVGPSGGLINKPATTASQPPPELVREVERENQVAALKASRLENPILATNRAMMQLEEFVAFMENYRGMDFEPNEPAPKGQPNVFYRFLSAHWAIRPTVVGPSSGNRDELLLRFCMEPWLKVEVSTPAQFHAVSRPSSFPVAQNINAPIREKFPSAIFTASKFLKSHRPVNGMDVSALIELARPDEGHEDEMPPEPPKQPTIQDLINGLTAALNRNPAP